MSLQFWLEWNQFGNSHRMNKPSWDDVNDKLRSVFHSGGSLTLILKRPPVTGPESLSFMIEHGQALPTMDVIIDDELWVRGYHDPGAAEGEVVVGGNPWSRSQVCFDLDVVLQIAQEFFLSGDVSEEIMI